MPTEWIRIAVALVFGRNRMVSWPVLITLVLGGLAIVAIAGLYLRRFIPWRRGKGVRRKPSLDFSLTGLVYCSLMMFMGLAAINSGANLLFGVFGLMIGILLISGVISRNTLRHLDVRRALPDHGIVGRPMSIVYEFENHKKAWPTLSVTISELDGAEGFNRPLQAYLLHVAQRLTAAVAVEVTPLRRGVHSFNRYQVSTSFPFGFIKRAANDRREGQVVVYPCLAQVDPRLLTICRAAENRARRFGRGRGEATSSSA